MAVRTLRRFVHPYLSSMMGDRGRTIANTAVWSLVAKLTAAANLFICIPFVLHALGPEEFGAWATLTSLVYFAGFLDFGFGNGTMNLVAAARGRGAADEVAIILRESRRTLARVAVCLALVVLAAMPLVPWHRLLGLPAIMAADSRNATAFVLFSIVLAVPLNLANRVQLGLGRGERAFRWQAAGQLLTLAAVVAFALAHASLPLLTLAAVGTPLLASAGNALSLRRDPTLQVPAHQPRRADIATQIRKEGILFFVMQLAAALAFSSDLPLISALRDPTQAGTYAIVQRLFSVIPLGLSLVWAPLWPTYRHALATGHHEWVVKTLKRSVLMAACIASVLGVVFATGFGWISNFWLHRDLAVGSVLLVGFAVWSLLEGVGTATSTLLNAASVMRFQVIVASSFAVLCFSGKAWMAATFGIEWFPWITVLTWSLTNALPFLWFRKRLLAEVFGRRY
ncbi:MAG: oligosaccharide flippase family protein [Proteobacteria bacterium]|nr:oligosaccharide flippase family protein [Pseudomonadota bacterium]